MQLQMAAQYLQAGRLKEAEALFKQHLASSPDDIAANYSLAELYIKQQHFSQATIQLEKVVSLAPGHTNALLKLYESCLAIDAKPQAESTLRKLIPLLPDNPMPNLYLGGLLSNMDRLQESADSYKKAISIASDDFPNIDKAYANLAGIYKDLGQFEEAETYYKKALDINNTLVEAHRCLAQIQPHHTHTHEMEVMEQLLTSPDLSKDAKVHLNFGLSKAYEDLAQYEKSFDHLIQARSTLRELTPFSIGDEATRFEAIKKIFSKELLDTYSNQGNISTSPIFVLGMPRSGTTLVEQILASHSQVYGAGELQSFQQEIQPLAEVLSSATRPADLPLQDIGQSYLESMPEASRSSRYIVNKMPQNLLYIGFIRMIFPNAKIIHCSREPIATCHSIFKNYFETPHAYANTLEDLRGYYKLYRDLMFHWNQIAPYSIYQIQYEELVDDFDAEVTALLNFIGLPIEQDCFEYHKNKRQVRTASFQQVRSPIYNSSLEAWKNFENHLQPLINALNH